MDITFTYSLTSAQQEQWRDFWQKTSHSHPRQHYVMGRVESAIWKTPIFVAGFVDSVIVITALFSIRPLWFGNKFSLEAVCIDGPVFEDPAYLEPFLNKVVIYFKSLNVGQIMVSPYWMYPEAEGVKAVLNSLGFERIGEPVPTGLVDLTKSEEEILMSFSKKARKEIRKSENENIEIRPADTLDEVRDHFDCYNAMRLERNLSGIRPLSWTEFSATYNCLKENPGLGEFVYSWHHCDFLAGRYILCGPATAFGVAYAIDYQVAHRVQNVSVGCGLFWRGFCWAKSKGCQYFDMEGYDETVQAGDALFAVYQFKRRFNPRQVYRLEPYIYRCNSVVYVLLRATNLFQRVEHRLRTLPYSILDKIRRKIHSPQTKCSGSESPLSDSETS